MDFQPASRARERSKGWFRVDTRGRLLPGQIGELLRLLDDSLSIRVPARARVQE